MCGICGVIEKHGKPVNEAGLHAMTFVMMHRGPDEERFWIDKSIGLGFRRLSIVDVTYGHQPMSNEDESVWVICNGEIYNHESLRHQLVDHGHHLHSNSDTEVIAHLYEEQGIGCLNQLRGMFGLAIFDCRTQTLYVARDHFGIKPVFYADTLDTFMFSSEMKSLLAYGGLENCLNSQALWDYLSFQYVPSSETMLKEIRKVPPGHYVSVQSGRISVKAYWQPEFEPDLDLSLDEFAEGIEAKLRESVHMHMNADVPIGAFLSSGVDSSSVVAMMRELGSVETFSVGFTAAPQQTNELQLSAETANLLKANHHSVEISDQQVRDSLSKIIYLQDDPVADPSAVALYFLCELAGSEVTVALSGEGADEVFGGYPIYHEPISLRPFEYLSPRIRKVIGGISRIFPDGLKGKGFLERGSIPIEERFIGNAKIWTEGEKPEVLRPFVRKDHASSYRVTDSIYQSTSHLHDITRMQMVDLQTWLPGDILMKADKMSMAHSLEVRVPFLDVELFELARKIPAKYLIRHGQTKYVLRQAVRNLLPEWIYNRPKLGFPVPYRQWGRGMMSDMMWDILHTGEFTTMFNMTTVEDLFHQHRVGARDNGRKLWTLMVFALWHQTFVENHHQFLAGISSAVVVRRERRNHGTLSTYGGSAMA